LIASGAILSSEWVADQQKITSMIGEWRPEIGDAGRSVRRRC